MNLFEIQASIKNENNLDIRFDKSNAYKIQTKPIRTIKNISLRKGVYFNHVINFQQIQYKAISVTIKLKKQQQNIYYFFQVKRHLPLKTQYSDPQQKTNDSFIIKLDQNSYQPFRQVFLITALFIAISVFIKAII